MFDFRSNLFFTFLQVKKDDGIQYDASPRGADHTDTERDERTKVEHKKN